MPQNTSNLSEGAQKLLDALDAVMEKMNNDDPKIVRNATKRAETISSQLVATLLAEKRITAAQSPKPTK